MVLQFSGVNAVIFNAVEIFSSAGSNINEYVENILLNVTQVSKGLLKYVLDIHDVISQRPVVDNVGAKILSKEKTCIWYRIFFITTLQLNPK